MSTEKLQSDEAPAADPAIRQKVSQLARSDTMKLFLEPLEAVRQFWASFTPVRKLSAP